MRSMAGLTPGGRQITGFSSMSRKQIIIAAVAVLVLVAAGVGAWFAFGDNDENPAPEEAAQTASTAAPEQKGPLPDPVVLVVDKSAILQMSKAGQDIGRQVQAYAQTIRAQIEPQAKALRAEGEAIRSQAASLSPEERQRRISAFESKQAQLQQLAASKEAVMKEAVGKAQQALSQKMGPILKDIMAQRHANMIVDKQAVVYGTDQTLDVTVEAVKRLDAALPSAKVDLPSQ